jgi:hypothetical protein
MLWLSSTGNKHLGCYTEHNNGLGKESLNNDGGSDGQEPGLLQNTDELEEEMLDYEDYIEPTEQEK